MRKAFGAGSESMRKKRAEAEGGGLQPVWAWGWGRALPQERGAHRVSLLNDHLSSLELLLDLRQRPRETTHQ
eukprot:391167-Prymnesium_polylepis.1